MNPYVPKAAVARVLPLQNRLGVIQDCLLPKLSFGLDTNKAEYVEPVGRLKIMHDKFWKVVELLPLVNGKWEADPHSRSIILFGENDATSIFSGGFHQLPQFAQSQYYGIRSAACRRGNADVTNAGNPNYDIREFVRQGGRHFTRSCSPRQRLQNLHRPVEGGGGL